MKTNESFAFGKCPASGEHRRTAPRPSGRTGRGRHEQPASAPRQRVGAAHQRRGEGGPDRAPRATTRREAGKRKPTVPNGRSPHDPTHDSPGKPTMKRMKAMQLHRLIGTDPPCTPRGRDGRHQTHNTTRVPNPCAQSAVAKLSRRGGGKAAGTHGEPRFGGIARALGAGARVTGTNGTSAPSAGKHPRGAWNTRDGAGRARTTQGGARLGRLARTFGASARFAAACLVAGCLALGLASPEAAAQTVKLVSNSSATASGNGARVGPYIGSQFSAGQEFTTGDERRGLYARLDRHRRATRWKA